MQHPYPSLEDKSEANPEKDRVEEIKVGAVEDVDWRANSPASFCKSRSQPSNSGEDFPKAHAAKQPYRRDERQPRRGPCGTFSTKLKGVERSPARFVDLFNLSWSRPVCDDLVFGTRIITVRPTFAHRLFTRQVGESRQRRRQTKVSMHKPKVRHACARRREDAVEDSE